MGQDVSVSSHCRNSEVDNTLWLWRDGYIVPDTLEMATAEDCCKSTEFIKAKPAMFNADGLCVEQNFVESKDGTRIPYFIIRRKDVKMDGSNAVLLDAYGGFEISMLPGYSAGVGAGWLERGGVKVIANIRGGVSSCCAHHWREIFVVFIHFSYHRPSPPLFPDLRHPAF